MPVARLVGKQQRSVRLALARGNLWEGAVRSSKTVSSILAWLRYVRTGPSGALLMVGKTERTLKRNIIDPIQEMVGARRCVYKIGSGELELLGRTIYTAGANDERAADKIKGMTLAGAYCDEVTTYPQSFFKMLGTRLSVDGAQWFGTTNPEGPAHWLHKEYIAKAALRLTRDGREVRSALDEPLDLNVFTFQLDDNPTLPPAYVAALKREYVGLFYRRYILGEWCLAEGVVYDTWDPDRHVVDELPPMRRHWLGIDYGTANPFAAILLGLGDDDRLYVVSEWRHDSRQARRQMTDAEYSAAVRAWLEDQGVTPEWSFIDPSAASFLRQMWTDGHPGLRKGKNEVLDGIRSVSSALASGRLLVHSSCTGLLDEIPGYSWDPKAQDKGEDKPIKADDHSCDALRYVVHSTARHWRHLLTAEMETAA